MSKTESIADIESRDRSDARAFIATHSTLFEREAMAASLRDADDALAEALTAYSRGMARVADALESEAYRLPIPELLCKMPADVEPLVGSGRVAESYAAGVRDSVALVRRMNPMFRRA